MGQRGLAKITALLLVTISFILIKGDNIFLRILTKEDCGEKYVNWLNDPVINKYLEIRWTKHNKESVVQFVQEVNSSGNSQLLGIFRNSDSSHIGNIKIGPINVNHQYADISYFIGDKDAWGCGYASEAVKLITKYGFEDLALNKCVAGVYSSNTASCKVLEKVGYTNEGCLKKHLKVGDTWEDHILYGFNRRDFKFE